MRVTTTFIIGLALAQCTFSASVTLTQPAENSFGTGTCFRMRWNRQGMPSSHHFNVTFIRKDGTVALEESTGKDNYYNVKLPAELATYTFYVRAFNDADGSVVAASVNKTAIVTDTSCYPEMGK